MFERCGEVGKIMYHADIVVQNLPQGNIHPPKPLMKTIVEMVKTGRAILQPLLYSHKAVIILNDGERMVKSSTKLAQSVVK